MRLMICGSRQATPEMLDYARRCVLQAVNKGYLILVGDALGVDGTVCEAAQRHNAACFVYGIAPQPRNGGVRNPRSLYVNLNAKKHAEALRLTPGEVTYTDRDQFLVRHTQIVICLWNGVSTASGTYRVYEYAKELSEQQQRESRRDDLGKKVILYQTDKVVLP